MEARLQSGFGPLDFGSSQEECLKRFGEPDEKETLEGLDGSSSAVWHYWQNGFSIFFDNALGSKFCCVEIDKLYPVEMFGRKIFGMSEIELTTLMIGHGHEVSEAEQHEWGERRITFDAIFADFYFERGKLVSINYSAPIGELQERTIYN